MSAAAPPSVLATAVAATSAGLVVTPLRAKRPYRRAWQLAANTLRTEREARDHFARHPGEGVGLVHEHSATCALDVDDATAARAALAARGLDLAAQLAAGVGVAGAAGRAKALFCWPGGGAPPRTVRVHSPSGAVAFELRGSGAQDVLPPSAHPTAGHYRWTRGAPDFARLPALPRALAALWLELLDEEGGAPREAPAQGGRLATQREPADPMRLLVEGAELGARNVRLFRALCALRRVGATLEQLEAYARAAAAACRPPLPLWEARRAAASAARYRPAEEGCA